jgi:hypothetical protein
MKKYWDHTCNKSEIGNSSILIAAFVLLQLSLLLSSCNAAGGIYNAGMGVGIFTVLAVAVVLVYIYMRMRKK